MDKTKLPEKFTARMKDLLGASYAGFISEYGGRPSRALRINTLYRGSENIVKALEGALAGLAPVPFEPGCFTFGEETEGERKIGNSPLHHAGAFYIQEPSAMSPLSCVPIRPDMKILDICASPGGKSVQAALRAPRGVLVSNEIVGSRARTLLSNIERTGIKNAIVTNTGGEVLSRWYDGVFDLVICDAPCSGEGMFRKNPEAIVEWSIDNVRMCAARQRAILDNAATTVGQGGYLLYSTCTFSLEENEIQVDAFLDRHRDFELCEITGEVLKSTAPGVCFDNCSRPEITRCRRFYPHTGNGEGQFFALMRRASGGRGIVNYKSSALPLQKSDRQIADSFLKDNTGSSDHNIALHGGFVCIVPDFPVPPFAVFGAGVRAGAILKGRFEPHHQFFSAFGQDMKNQIEFESGQAERYLRGMTLEMPDALSGWCALTVSGIPLGGGKAVSGVIKNHYPKGLRLPPE